MNSLTKLNDALFHELERLESIDRDSEKLREEIDRAKAVANLAGAITCNHRLALEVARERAVMTVSESIQLPAMLKEEGE